MRPLQDRIPAQAGSLSAGPTQRPTLVAPVFYSPRGEPALVASTPAALRSSAPGGAGRLHWQAAKEFLARFLAKQLLERKLPDLTLGRDPLGKPQIWLGAVSGPALSFSWGAGRLWAAVGRSERGLGLDAAAPGEFTGSYPYQRVFMAAEWQSAVTLTAGNREEAAALLWSVKEAVVKARGCGFHFLSPRQVQVLFAGRGEHGYLWHGCLGNPDPEGILPGGREACPAVSVRLKEVWLSVAWGR
jgi:phosphopantetheinyl transferase